MENNSEDYSALANYQDNVWRRPAETEKSSSLFDQSRIDTQLEKLKYAEQQSIAFAEWLDSKSIFRNGEGLWVNADELKWLTSNELFALYKSLEIDK